MNEAVFRRYKRLLNEEKPLPQLIFIDGGKGQLTAAAAAMQSLDLEMIPLVGLVKPPKHHNRISHLLRYGYEEKPIQFEAGLPVFRSFSRSATKRTKPPSNFTANAAKRAILQAN